MCGLLQIRSLLLRGIDYPLPDLMAQPMSNASNLDKTNGFESDASPVDALDSASQACSESSFQGLNMEPSASNRHSGPDVPKMLCPAAVFEDASDSSSSTKWNAKPGGTELSNQARIFTKAQSYHSLYHRLTDGGRFATANSAAVASASQCRQPAPLSPGPSLRCRLPARQVHWTLFTTTGHFGRPGCVGR